MNFSIKRYNRTRDKGFLPSAVIEGHFGENAEASALYDLFVEEVDSVVMLVANSVLRGFRFGFSGDGIEGKASLEHTRIMGVGSGRALTPIDVDREVGNVLGECTDLKCIEEPLSCFEPTLYDIWKIKEVAEAHSISVENEQEKYAQIGTVLQYSSSHH